MKNTLWLLPILLLFVSAALAETQTVPADIVARLRRQAQATYVDTQIPHNEEFVAALLSNGSVVYRTVIDRRGTFRLPHDIVLLLHTQPHGGEREPSDADKATAKKIWAPNCVVTAGEVWCAMPNGNIVRGMALASTPTAQTAGVSVQVYDYAGLEPSTLQKIVQGTQEILRATGISINVVLCEKTAAASCDGRNNRETLVLRVEPGSAKKMKNVLYSPLGQSFADHSGGKYASVFLECIEDQARKADVPWLRVFDYAAAHEIGHLLLGDQAHTPRGIMRERWDLNDYLEMSQGRLHFSDEQIRQLRSRYGIYGAENDGYTVKTIPPY